MIRAQPSSGDFADRRLPIGIITPRIDLDITVDAKPCGVDVVLQILGQIKLAFEKTGSATGVNDPATGQRMFDTPTLERSSVLLMLVGSISVR